MSTVKEIYLEAKKQLLKAGIDDPGLNAAAIIKKHFGIQCHEIALCGDKPAKTGIDDFWADIERRKKREPLQYIIGIWPFYGLDFYVGEGVLIPRPDTEILAETAVNFLKGRKNPKLLELCAGSGCVSTVAAKNVENCSLCCVEISDKALFYLKKNLEFHGLSEKSEVLKADVLSSDTPKLLKGEFDAIVCNPPYIKSGDIASLEPEVKTFEPPLALDGGGDGLLFYRAAKNYASLLKPGGMAAFEVGAGQADDVAALLESFGLCGIFIKKDFGGIDRVVGGFNKN